MQDFLSVHLQASDSAKSEGFSILLDDYLVSINKQILCFFQH